MNSDESEKEFTLDQRIISRYRISITKNDNVCLVFNLFSDLLNKNLVCSYSSTITPSSSSSGRTGGGRP